MRAFCLTFFKDFLSMSSCDVTFWCIGGASVDKSFEHQLEVLTWPVGVGTVHV